MFWRFFRSWVVLTLFFASLLSILFSGAFDIHELAKAVGAQALRAVVVQNLFFGSVLMAMHAIYLGVMLYHLIFRHPVDDERFREAIVFVIIAWGYVFHAAHDYFEGTEGFASSPVWRFLSPTLFFAVAYFLMAVLGWLAWLKEPKREKSHPALHSRESWMLCTDTALFVLLLGLFCWEFLRGDRPLANLSPFAGVRLSPIAQAWSFQLDSYGHFKLGRLLKWLAPKDWAILTALLLYGFIRIVLKRNLKREGADFRLKMLEQHKLDANAQLPKIKTYLEAKLPANSVWLDFKCEYGLHLAELFDVLELRPDRVVIPENSETNGKVVERLGQDVTVEPRKFPERSVAVAGMLAKINLVHVANVAYRSSSAREVLRFLSQARPGTILLLRYTSGASYYRAVSSSMSCAPIRPYVHHAIHDYLVRDLKRQNWVEQCDLASVVKCHLRHLRSDETRHHVVNWVESQYGEFSGDIIERYLKAFSDAGVTELKHFELMRVFVKGLA